MPLLDAIDIPAGTAQHIENLGNEAVTVICEAALGSYPGLRQKVRTNAVALVGQMSHPQARETLALLLGDPDVNISIRALRAAGRQRNEELVEKIARVLLQPNASGILAAEALAALLHIDSPEARLHVKAYDAASADEFSHRSSLAVEQTLLVARKDEILRPLT